MVLLCLCLPQVVWAQSKHVLVQSFSGPGAAGARKAVVDTVKGKHDIVATRRWQKARKKLRVRKDTAKSLRALAREVNVDVIVDGVMAKKGARWELRLEVREGKSAKTKRVSIPLRSPRIDAAGRRSMRQRLLPVIDGMRPVGREAARPERDERAEPKETARERRARLRQERDERRRREAEGAERADEDDEFDDDSGLDGEFEDDDTEEFEDDDEFVDAQDDEEDEDVEFEDGERDTPEDDGEEPAARVTDDEEDPLDEGDQDDAPSSAPGERSLGRVSGGLSFMARRMSFTYTQGLMDIPGGYDGNPVPGAYLRAELYPLSALPNLGIEGYVDRVLTLKSQLASGGAEFTTTQMRFGAGLAYRIPFGDSPRPTALTLRGGYHQLSFSIDTMGTPIDLPDVTYSMASAGASLSVPLGSRLALVAGGNYLHILGTGAMELPANYGGGTVIGLDAEVALELMATRHVIVRAGGQFLRMAYDFDGTGMKTTNRDADPDQDVGGALDVYFGGFVTAGYVF